MTFSWEAGPCDLQRSRGAVAHVVWMLTSDALGYFTSKMDLCIDLFLNDDMRAMLLEVGKSLEK